MGMVWVAALADDERVRFLRNEPDAVYDFVTSEEALEDGHRIDLDKEWHATHFLLTGSAEATADPLSLILGPFATLGPDHGYGPAWFVPASAIKACDEALDALDDAVLAQRYDPQAMNRAYVYLADVFVDDGDEGLAYLRSRVEQLREFVRTGAESALSAFALIT